MCIEEILKYINGLVLFQSSPVFYWCLYETEWRISLQITSYCVYSLGIVYGGLMSTSFSR